MEVQIADLKTMVAQDNQDIYDRLIVLKRHVTLNTVNGSLPLLYDLQDMLTLYQYIKQTAIYDRLYPDHNLKMVRFTEIHSQSMIMLRRSIHSIKRRNKPRYLAQLYILSTLLAIYLEEEYQYLNHILSEQFSDQQTQQMARHYEQLKLSPP